MRTFAYTLTHPLGLHARPCFALSGEADDWNCETVVSCKGQRANARERLELMGLNLSCSDELTVSFEGPDEDAAHDAFFELLRALDLDRDE